METILGRNVEEVRKLFDWDDRKTYSWLLVPGKDIYGFIGTALGVILWLVGSFALLWLIGLISEVVAFWLGLVVGAGLIFLYLSTYLVQWKGVTRKHRVRASKFRWGLSFLSIGFFFYAMNSPASFICEGFIGTGDSELAPWLLFFADNTISTLTLGISSALGLTLSDISPLTPLANFSVTLLRLLIAAGILQMFLVFYRTFLGDQQFYATVQGCYLRLEALPLSAVRLGLKLGRVGRVQMSKDLEVTRTDIFVKAFDKEAKDTFRSS